MKSIPIIGIVLIAAAASASAAAGPGRAQNSTSQEEEGRKRGFGRSIFNVVSFPNDVCAAGSGRNGTCYTSSECTTHGGVASGSCASGYGVCCLILLQCGKTSSDNNTFLVMGSTSTPPSTCIYTICPASSSICRIRLDFSTFTIAQPVQAAPGAVAPAANNVGGSIGDCVVDFMTVTSPGNRASPQICGTNTNQHMFIEASKSCLTVAFKFQNAAVTRSYDIKVTQFNCGDEKAGPPECLQYFTSPTGTISSYNFFTTNGAVVSTATHLSNQNYDICIRRTQNSCGICYTPSIPTSTSAESQASFGLSVSGAPAAQSLNDASCTSDYLVIPVGVSGSGAPIALNNGFPAASINRICGRFFAANGIASSQTVCSTVRPFRISFRTDADELTNLPVGGATADTNELQAFPQGALGFSLTYFQFPCPIPVSIPSP